MSTRDLVEEVIEAADVREVRYRRLPAHLMVIFVVSCWLFMRSGYGLVMSKLADAHAVAGRGWGDWEVPTTGSITKARVRLGAVPLRLGTAGARSTSLRTGSQPPTRAPTHRQPPLLVVLAASTVGVTGSSLKHSTAGPAQQGLATSVG